MKVACGCGSMGDTDPIATARKGDGHCSLTPWASMRGGCGASEWPKVTGFPGRATAGQRGTAVRRTAKHGDTSSNRQSYECSICPNTTTMSNYRKVMRRLVTLSAALFKRYGAIRAALGKVMRCLGPTTVRLVRHASPLHSIRSTS